MNFLEDLSKDHKKNIIDEILFMISDCFLSSLSIDFIDNENILNINSWIINNMNVPDKKIWEAGKSEYLSQLKNEFK